MGPPPAHPTHLPPAAFWVYHWELGRGSGLDVARTAVVNMLVMSDVFYLFNVRPFTASAWCWETLVGNSVAVWAGVITLGLQALFTYAPPCRRCSVRRRWMGGPER